jgi:hypothetical protein
VSVIPDTLAEKLEFFEARLAEWATNAAAIGLTPGQVTGIAAITAEARAKYSAATAARASSKSATIEQKIAFDALNTFGGDLVKTIRTFAETNNNPGVYALASIPEPAEPTPLGPPEAPTETNAALNLSGGIDITFKASKTGGTTFVVERRTVELGGTPPTGWTQIGITETKTFTDSALPQGLASAHYRVIATRSGGVSAPSQSADLQFGTVANGSQTSSATATTNGIKLAA